MLSWYNVFPFVFVLIVSCGFLFWVAPTITDVITVNLFMVVAALPVAELQLSNHVMAVSFLYRVSRFSTRRLLARGWHRQCYWA